MSLLMTAGIVWQTDAVYMMTLDISSGCTEKPEIRESLNRKNYFLQEYKKWSILTNQNFR